VDNKKVLLKMVKTLAVDLQNIQQRGAGYYSAAPFVDRYNRLLEKTKMIFEKEDSVLIATFPILEDTPSVDPSDKMKVVQRVMIEIGQLIAYIEASIE
jgi:hypothetical protein